MTATLTEWDHAVAPPWKMVMCTNRRFVSRALNTEVASTERERESAEVFPKVSREIRFSGSSSAGWWWWE